MDLAPVNDNNYPDDLLDILSMPENYEEAAQLMSGSISINITRQPSSFCRARYTDEIADFQSRGSSGTCGSRLTGRGDAKSHLTVSLSASNSPVSGRLIGLPVDCNSDSQHKLHLYSLIGHCCSNGVYIEQVDLSPGVVRDFMLTKLGIVIAKKKNQNAVLISRTQLLESLYNDPKSLALFQPNYGGTLSVDPMSEFDEKLRLLFTFIPDQPGWPVKWLTTDPIRCQAGAAGGKTHLEVKEINPKCVQLDPIGDNAWLPREDVWLHLDTALKVKTESLSAEVYLSDAPDNLPGIVVDAEVAKGNDLVKIRLTRLTCGQLCSRGFLPSSERFQATIRLIKLSAKAGRADTVRETVDTPVTFECSAPVKRKRARQFDSEEIDFSFFKFN